MTEEGRALRVTLFAGHYGSGKTNIAVNYALRLAAEGKPVTIADLDIVNPYFRTKDSAAELAAAGVRLIASPYAGSNVDVPALPQELYALSDDRSRFAVLDIGGDDRGALALGRFVPALREENSYEMLLVVNFARPLSRTPEDVMNILSEIEAACHLPFTGLVHNTNLGEESSAELLLSSDEKMRRLCRLSGLPLRMTTVRKELYPALEGKLPNLFPLTLQKKPFR